MPGFLQTVSRALAPVAAGLALAVSAAAQETPSGDDAERGHMLEELGVNRFTSPSTAELLDEMRALLPLPAGAVGEPRQPRVAANRGVLAMRFGTSVADGFLIAVTENQTGAEGVARSLMRLAKALAVSGPVTGHADSLSELVARRQWDALTRELTTMQADVEASLVDLRDEEVAHLIAFGGWVRGMEICARAVADRHTPQRASRLLQTELLGYFADRLRTLQPDWLAAEPFRSLRTDLDAAAAVLAAARDETLEKKQVDELADIASRMVERIVGNDP